MVKYYLVAANFETGYAFTAMAQGLARPLVK
jgi:hypothetical protein